MAGVERGPQYRAGTEKDTCIDASQGVTHPQTELLDRESASGVQGHERPALPDEGPERRHTLRPEPARVLLGHGPRRVAPEEDGGGLVGEHDRVEALPQPPAADLPVVEGAVGDAHLLFKDEAGPALVDGGDPGPVEADPRNAEAKGAGRAAHGAGGEPELVRERLERAARRGGDEERPRRERAAVFGEGFEGPADAHAGGEQAAERP